MAKQLQKLELTWIGKGNEPQLEPRILIEDTSKSFGDPHSENMLIHGDNLLALKALEQDYAGKIKCIYIDPPFNTKAIFEHYDDGLEHSIWLDLMHRRISIIHRLLEKSGSLFIHLDDNEVDYCKVILDEIFGRNNFINRITIEARSPSAFSTVNPGVFKASEYLLWYAKDKQYWESRSMRISSNRDAAYNKFILNRFESEDKWVFTSLRQAFLESHNTDRVELVSNFLERLFNEGRDLSKNDLKLFFSSEFELSPLLDINQIINYFTTKLKIKEYNEFWKSTYLYFLEKCSYNFGDKELDLFVFENADAVWRETEISDEGAGKEVVSIKYSSKEQPKKVFKLIRDKGLDPLYILNGKQISFYKKNVERIDGKLTATKLLTNVWTDISWEGIAAEGGVKFKKGKKPERLLKRCFELTSHEGDIVLDSFLGSGSTAAVAHKMNRRWIGIELGEQAVTHCLPRLQKVVKGEDNGGVTEAVNWKGGGGFKFYTLAPSLIQKDRYGNEVINPEYNATMLAAAMARQEGFRYSPIEGQYWKQGFSSEKDYIFTTTQFVTVQMLDRLADELKSDESLLVCCKSFAKGCTNRHLNITIKKIPQMLLGRCEFGKDDYSLNIVNLPHSNEEGEDEISDQHATDMPEPVKPVKTGKPDRPASGRRKGTDDTQATLFK